MIDQAYAAARSAIMSADTDEVTRCTAIALMAGYALHWANDEWETVSVEEEFHLPLLNPETGRPSKTFTWAGKRDAKALKGGRRFTVEHKTTTEDISDPNCLYRRRLSIDGQVSAYALASWQEGEKIDGTLYDVIRKPTIKPKAIAQKQRAEIASLYAYAGQKVSQQTRDLVVAGLEKENGELYGLRVQADIAENPSKYFQRWRIMRLDNELLEFAEELWDIGQEIRDANSSGKHYKNAGACVQYGTCCEFLGVCGGFSSLDSDRWVKAESPHSELTKAGPDALTHSRIKCFLSCRKKHHYRYNLGYRRHQDEDSEALQFGTLLHKALEAYWAAFIPEKNDGDSHESTASEAHDERQATAHAGQCD